jgi:hypothetical protein
MKAITWMRVVMAACALVNLVIFALFWIGGDFNSTILINSGLLLGIVYLSNLNDEYHRIIREQNELIQRMIQHGFHLP